MLDSKKEITVMTTQIVETKGFINYVANHGHEKGQFAPDVVHFYTTVNEALREHCGELSYVPRKANWAGSYIKLKDINGLFSNMGVGISPNGKALTAKCDRANEVSALPSVLEWKSTNIPLEWLSARGIEVVKEQFVGLGDMPYCYKLFGIAANAALRGIMYKLMASANKLCFVDIGSDGLRVAKYHLEQNRGFIRSEEGMKGIRGRYFPTNDTCANVWRAKVEWDLVDGKVVYCGKSVPAASVFGNDALTKDELIALIKAMPREGLVPDLRNIWDVVRCRGLWLFELPNKVNERVTKIYGNEDGVPVGVYKLKVMLDCPTIGGTVKMGASAHKAYKAWVKNLARTIMRNINEKHKWSKAERASVDAFIGLALPGLIQEMCLNSLNTGAMYSDALLFKLGAARLVTKLGGVKGTVATKSPFRGVNQNDVLLSASAFKGGLNTICDMTGVISRAEQISLSAATGYQGKEMEEVALAKLREKGLVRRATCSFMGHACTFEYVEVEEEVYATNLYSLYGYRYTDEYTDELAFVEEAETSSSYYTYIINNIGGIESIPQQIMEDLEDGIIYRRGQRTSFSLREVYNYYFSYVLGQDEHGKYVVNADRMRALIDEAKADHANNASDTHKAMHAMVVEGLSGMEVIDIEQMTALVEALFVDIGEPEPELMGEVSPPSRTLRQIPTTGWKLEDHGNITALQNRWDLLVNGGETIDGCWWPGLASEKGLRLIIDGNEFIIPSMAFIKRDIFPVDKDTVGTVPEYHFGEGMQSIMNLLVATRRRDEALRAGKEDPVNWNVNCAQHLVRMNSCIFEDELNRLNVRGGYVVVQAKFWGMEKPGYAHSATSMAFDFGKDTDGLRKLTKKVSISKDPNLFGKGFSAFIMNRYYSPHVFGQLSEVERFVMRSVCHVSNPFLMNNENDADGDMVCVRPNIGASMPLYDGAWDAMSARVQKYVMDENNIKLKMKPWKWYTLNELQEGVDHSMQAKMNVSIMTANFYRACLALDASVTEGKLNPKWAKLLWSLNGYIVQDEAMRQVKSEMGGSSAFYSIMRMSQIKPTMYDRMLKEADPASKGLVQAGVLLSEGVYGTGDGVVSRFKKYSGKSFHRIEEITRINCQAFADAFNAFNMKHYDGIKGRRVSGMLTGVADAKNLYQTLDIGEGVISVHQDWKAFSFLSRGYYKSSVENCPTVSSVAVVADIVKDHNISTANVQTIIDGLSEEVVYVEGEQLHAYCVNEFQAVYDGYIDQNTLIGNCYIPTYNATNTCVMNWMAMIGEIVAEGYPVKEVFEEEEAEEIAEATPVVVEQEVVVDGDAVIDNLIEAFAEQDTDINYPEYEHDTADVSDVMFDASEVSVYRLKKGVWAIVVMDDRRNVVRTVSSKFNRLSLANEALAEGSWDTPDIEVEYDLDEEGVVVFDSGRIV